MPKSHFGIIIKCQWRKLCASSNKIAEITKKENSVLTLMISANLVINATIYQIASTFINLIKTHHLLPKNLLINLWNKLSASLVLDARRDKKENVLLSIVTLLCQFKVQELIREVKCLAEMGINVLSLNLENVLTNIKKEIWSHNLI